MSQAESSRAQGAIIAVATAAGAATVAIAISLDVRLGVGSIPLLVSMTAMLVASWVRPLIMYHEAESEAVHLDEGFFVVLVLLVPAGAAITAFIVAGLIAQVIRRRSLLKSLFNFGQVSTAAALGVATVYLLAPPAGRLSGVSLLAALAGAVVFFLVNSAAVVAIVATTHRRRVLDSFFDGVEIHLLVLVACVILGATAALAVSSYPWSVAVAALPFLVFRHVLAGHFSARHDRTRLLGLFDVALSAHRSMGSAEVEGALTRGAGELLRCRQAQLSDCAAGPGELGVAMPVGDRSRWLVVAGRPRSEPFDAADGYLLQALAAVGAGALANAQLYEEGSYQRERLATITSSLGEGVCALDEQGHVTFLNPAAEQMLGWTEADVRDGQAHGRGTTVSALDFLAAPALRAMRSESTVRADDAMFYNADGTSFPVDLTCSPVHTAGDSKGAVLVFRDITERKAMQEHAHQAFHDFLTGLPNRRVFLDHLTHALARSERDGRRHAVLFADVDRFKMVNDSLGHDAGDQLIIAIADRLRSVIRPGDTLARFGGDEFTILLEDVDAHDAEQVARRMVEAARTVPTVSGGLASHASLSIGIALSTGRESHGDLLHAADVAMYQAKGRGGGSYAFFDAVASGARSATRLDLETGLRRAVERGEIEVHYQPIWSAEANHIVGVEALMRWNRAGQGAVGPGGFIGVAEEVGLILPIGRVVLEEACRQARRWREELGVSLKVSVNLSAGQFHHCDLVAEVASVLESTGVEPRQVCLEIAQAVASDGTERTIGTMQALKGLGLQLAIDDFGTAHSSITSLRRLPIDTVKLDQRLIDELETNPVDSAIVEAFLRLIKGIGMSAIAAGVETAGQLARLRELGCPLVQGYHLARPLTHAGVTALLLEQVRSTRREHVPERQGEAPPVENDSGITFEGTTNADSSGTVTAIGAIHC